MISSDGVRARLGSDGETPLEARLFSNLFLANRVLVLKSISETSHRLAYLVGELPEMASPLRQLTLTRVSISSTDWAFLRGEKKNAES